MLSSFRLPRTGFILSMVVCIFLIVGIDVGINSISGQFLMDKLGMDAEPAKQGRSLYFFGKILGTFSGALLLTRFSARKFLLLSASVNLVTIVLFIIAPSPVLALAAMFAIGMGLSNIFPLIFSLTVEKYTERTNEVSGLMIMAIAGGAFIPPIIGKVTDTISITAGMLVLLVCAVYLLGLSLYSQKK
jgi:fucose permease